MILLLIRTIQLILTIQPIFKNKSMFTKRDDTKCRPSFVSLFTAVLTQLPGLFMEMINMLIENIHFVNLSCYGCIFVIE